MARSPRPRAADCSRALSSMGRSRVSRAGLPHADDVPGRVAEGRDPQVALRVRRGDDLAALRDDALERFVDLLDEDVGPHARLAGNQLFGGEMPDHMAAAVRETRLVSVGA